ncbi:UDP-N-acetyl-D-mannosamine dehydrogenase [Pyrococcus abyssi]|uniref:UDP-N-acetyl-D-mannosamine dehydrogenase n=1 Tax=Pyrococcus abyssi (strain GE5 / Orsay) TaxID=272844 RepID=Q9V180_PYRAB|nr:UDP-N-acetyl-D-mannosamine dehydrogenase [Pyrococcus abyssi]CAB49470.1 UDP-N-acetyl-D-mannosaminuronic acid dehydrogenase [Pyrococcus abyssi GE5]CCE69937.1 TPA: udp-n-acetyl-d-mannosaminuronic acid dehydrogenase [Pyrococcus abyssi GE5]
MRIAVIGLGYIGLPTAIMFASSGHDVIGYDIRRDVVEKVNRGIAHIVEPEIGERLREVVSKGKLRATSDYNDLKGADAFIICVQTPLSNGVPDLTYLESAIKTIAKVIEKEALVVIESTVPPGTTERMAKLLEELTGLKEGEDFYVAHAPERVMPGRIFKELVYNSRIIGGVSEKASILAEKLYRSFVKGRIFLTTATTAEMVKLMENTFRDVNIALANEFAFLAHKYGVNVYEAIELANTHPRVKIHRPGIGVGGHCLPKDPYLLLANVDEDLGLIRKARKINESMPRFAAKLLFEALGEANVDPGDAVVLVLGLAYKGDTDDVRNSPALEFIKIIEKDVKEVRTYDPYVNGTHTILEEAVKGVDAIIIATDHSMFREIEWDKLGNLMRNKIIIDGRNLVKEPPKGFIFKGIGRGDV